MKPRGRLPGSAHPRLGWVSGALLLALAGWWAGRSVTAPDLAHRLDLPAGLPARYGVVVLHPEDCAGAWQFLELLARDEIRTTIPLVAFRLKATAPAPSWREPLPAPFEHIPAARLSLGARRALGAMGMDADPLLLLFDEGRLVGIERAATDGVALSRLGRRLRTWDRPFE